MSFGGYVECDPVRGVGRIRLPPLYRYIGPDWATSTPFFSRDRFREAALPRYFPEIPCIFEFTRNSRNGI